MIIQRWQSLLLFICVVMMAFFTFFSLGQIQTFNQTYNVTTWGIHSVSGEGELNQQTIYIFAISLLSAILSLIAIFCFKNFKLQKLLCKITALLIIAACLSEYFAIYQNNDPNIQYIGLSSIVVCPFVALVALIVAWGCINSDKKKLESMDRLW